MQLLRKKTAFLIIISCNLKIIKQSNNTEPVTTFMELFIGNTVCSHYAPSTYFLHAMIVAIQK